MRYYLLLLSFTCIALPAHAQPVLDSLSSAPRAGEAFNYYVAPGQNPGGPGAAQTWNFSAISHSSTYRVDYHPCAASPHCGTFPGSSLVSITPGVHYFMGLNGDSLYQTGAWYDRATDISEVYLDPQISLRFPLTFGDAYADSFRLRQIVGGDTLTRSGSDSTLADGWGTIIIKGNTISGALRVKKVLTMQDRIDTGSGGPPIIYHTRAETYQWYLPGYHDYLLYTANIATDIPFLPAVRSEARYTAKVGGTGIAQAGRNAFVVTNPARQQLHLTLPSPAASGTPWQITDLQGRTLLQNRPELAAGKSQLDIPLAELAPGMYLISLGSGAQRHTQRFVVQ